MFKGKVTDGKGQILSLDLIVGVSIFFILLAICVLAWGQIVYRMEQQKTLQEMQNNLMLASDLLVKSPGVPSAWENDPVKLKVLGLAEDTNSLAKEKVSAFLDINYSESKRYLGILKYDYEFLLLNVTAGTLVGGGATPRGDLRITVNRIVEYNDDVAIMRLTVFSNHSLEHISSPFL